MILVSVRHTAVLYTVFEYITDVENKRTQGPLWQLSCGCLMYIYYWLFKTVDQGGRPTTTTVCTFEYSCTPLTYSRLCSGLQDRGPRSGGLDNVFEYYRYGSYLILSPHRNFNLWWRTLIWSGFELVVKILMTVIIISNIHPIHHIAKRGISAPYIYADESYGVKFKWVLHTFFVKQALALKSFIYSLWTQALTLNLRDSIRIDTWLKKKYLQSCDARFELVVLRWRIDTGASTCDCKNTQAQAIRAITRIMH